MGGNPTAEETQNESGGLEKTTMPPSTFKLRSRARWYESENATLAKGKGIDYGNRQSLLDHHEVHELLDAEVAKTMEKFSRYEQIKKYALLPNEWTIESGETTPKLSVKRKVVEKNYAKEIDGIYAG